MKLTNPFKKRKKDLPDIRFHQGSYRHLREKPPRNNKNIAVVRKESFSFKKLFGKYKFRVSSLLLLPLITLFGSIAYLVFFSDFFLVKDIVIEIGIEERESERLRNALINKNSLFLSVYSIENIIHDTVQYTKSTYVRKIYPNKIEIKIEAQTPDVYYLDFQKYALLDTNLEVIELGSIPTPIDVTEVQRQLLEGELTVDSDYIQRRYIENLEEEEIADFDWKEVLLEEKESILNEITIETEQIINEYFASRSGFLTDNLGEYPIIKFYEYSFEESLDSKLEEITLSKEVINEIKATLTDVVIEDIRWKNPIRLEIKVSGGKTLIFGGINKTEIEEQIKRFVAISKTDKFSQFSIFDFRTENFTGRN